MSEKEENKKINLDVEINPENLKEVFSWRQIRKDLVKQAQAVGIDITEENIQDYSDFKFWSHKVNEKLLEIEAQDVLAEIEGEDVNLRSEAPSGSAPLTPAQTGEQTSDLEFESLEDMINFLYRKEKAGTSEEREGAKAVLDKLFEKWWKGQKNPAYKGFEIEGKQTWKDVEKEMRKRRLLKEKALKEEIENV